MIIDTIYLLPLARISIQTDLLKALVEQRLRRNIGLGDIRINLISIFELQAKAAKLGIPPEHVSRAINTVFKVFNVIPFYRGDIVEQAYKLRRELVNDYIDSIILATAIVENEDLATEDQILLSLKQSVEEIYGIKILNYDDLVK